MFKYFDSIWAETQLIPRGYLLPVSEFLLKIKSYTYRDSDEFKEIDNILRTADIVIWNNITNFILSAEQQIILDAYIGQRISNGKSNIFNGIEPENMVNTVEYNLFPILIAATTFV